MQDKELIKQEIERLKHNTPNAYDLSRFMLLEEIESFINSLPEESGCEVNFTTKNENLNEEISKWRNHYISVLDNNLRIDLRDIEVTANYFAEWQKKKDFEELLKSDMTQFKKCYEKGKADAMKEMKEALQTEYEKGRFDMREEIIKDAVEGTVKYEIGSAEIPQCDRRYQVLSDPTHITNAKLGDKAKIIILKTE